MSVNEITKLTVSVLAFQ